MARTIQPRETGKGETLKDRIRHYLTMGEYSAQDIADILGSDVRLVYLVQREMRLAGQVEPSKTQSHEIAEIRETLREVLARLARLEGHTGDVVSRRLR
jgi:transposase